MCSDFTDPIANLRINPNTQPASQNQYSIGIDRELRPDLAISGTFVKKDARGYGSWDVLNATYGRETVIADNGQSLEVFPLLSDPADRIFIMTDRQEMHMDYTSFLVSMNKRWSDNWQALISYSWSRTEGLLPSSHEDPGFSQEATIRGGSGASIGRDPNDFTNTEGRLLNDRTHMFRIQGSVILPKIDVRLGTNYQYFTGKPFAGTARVGLPQGTRDIYVDNPGAIRLPNQHSLDFRVSKEFRFGETGKFEFLVDILNLLNEDATEEVVTRNIASPNFAVGERWIDPRRAFIGLKFAF